MSEGDLPKADRQQQILELARRQTFVSVRDVSRLFGTSEVTTCGDLQALERQGKLRRVRGGAVSERSGPQRERPFVESLGAHAEEKSRIGRAAAALVVPERR
jgi:DeoR family transcriptional regulator of aga operon